ncbi:mRNA stability protein [Smittium culicis]|uniref:mRNA stability protein n=1 Tax=Smittium culicis TaxID=133412 RepID=A0A1R1YDS1_9FUNG|nr:mRNA stability protein [Smittium culicis]OMJ25071.1 mRNA stability protein [Smittium culicis]
MNPARQQKVDFTKLTEDEKKKFKLFGTLPSNKNILTQRIKERKYFDSGDYALSKAGKAGTTVGEKHPSPESIPHHQLNQPVLNSSSSFTSSAPLKESMLSNEPSSVDTDSQNSPLQ